MIVLTTSHTKITKCLMCYRDVGRRIERMGCSYWVFIRMGHLQVGVQTKS